MRVPGQLFHSKEVFLVNSSQFKNEDYIGYCWFGCDNKPDRISRIKVMTHQECDAVGDDFTGIPLKMNYFERNKCCICI